MLGRHRPWGLPPPGSRRRAFARGGSPPRCAAWHPAPLPRAPPVSRCAALSCDPCTHAHYPGGAMGTSRPTAITHAGCAPPFSPRTPSPRTPSRRTARVPSPGPFAIRSRCGRARCLAAGPPGSRRRAAWRGGATWHPRPNARAMASSTR